MWNLLRFEWAILGKSIVKFSTGSTGVFPTSTTRWGNQNCIKVEVLFFLNALILDGWRLERLVPWSDGRSRDLLRLYIT